MDNVITTEEMMRWQEYFGGLWYAFAAADKRRIPASLWASKKDNIIRYLVGECPSTMDVGASLLTQGCLPPWSWVLAVAQTQGRGQLGRSWISRSGNLFATIRLPHDARRLGNLLALALGAVLVEVMAELGLPAEVKWPNDILVGRTKVGGVLVEERGRDQLAGIGINVALAPEADRYSRPFKIPAGSLQTFGAIESIPGLWVRVERLLRHRLSIFIRRPGHVVDRLRTCLAFKGEPVIVTHAGLSDAMATLVGISTTGGLVIRTARGDQVIERGQIFPRVA